MKLENLKEILQQSGVVGAGGAGFPTYAKLDSRVDIILLNCAECEPLLTLHRQLLALHAREILTAFSQIAETLEAKQAIVGIKKEYKKTVEAVEHHLKDFPLIKINLLDSVYPAGDEVVLVYEMTGRVLGPGAKPVDAGIAVFNVETMYNAFLAIRDKKPVTSKFVTVTGAVRNPLTLHLPIGMSLKKAVELAGGENIKNVRYLVGGPMMGKIGKLEQPITKTTNAILVLPEDHILIAGQQLSPQIGLNRAAAACCQCQVCTDLCPRHALGHPIQPHLFMRAACNNDTSSAEPFINTMFCSGCGVCEMYACPQGLDPRSLIAVYKNELRRNGVGIPANVKGAGVNRNRQERKLPEGRLESRIALNQYKSDAPIDENLKTCSTIEIFLSQHIGAPAVACVKRGDLVQKDQVIADMAQGALSISMHTPFSGIVESVTKTSVVVTVQ